MACECESSGGPSRPRSEDSFLLARTVGSSGGMAEAGSSPLTEEEERNHGPQHTIFPGAGVAAAVQRARPAHCPLGHGAGSQRLQGLRE